MGTSCLIVIKSFPSVAIDKHYDGYYSGVVPFLKYFVEEFFKGRGFYDPEYMFAQLLRWTADPEIQKKFPTLGNDKFCGWGVVLNNGDMSYDHKYVITDSGNVIEDLS